MFAIITLGSDHRFYGGYIAGVMPRGWMMGIFGYRDQMPFVKDTTQYDLLDLFLF